MSFRAGKIKGKKRDGEWRRIVEEIVPYSLFLSVNPISVRGLEFHWSSSALRPNYS